MKTKIFFSIFAILFIFTFNCCNDNSFSVAGNQGSDQTGLQLQNIFDSLYQINPTLKDFRTNSNLNPRIVLSDIAGTGEEGTTIITCDGLEIFHNSWNIPSYEQHHMKTQVRHGFSSDNKIYFLWVYNESADGHGGYYSDYKLFMIQNNGSISDIHSKFKYYNLGVQEYIPGQYIVKSTDGWVRNEQPGYYSIFYADGRIENYSVPWDKFK